MAVVLLVVPAGFLVPDTCRVERSAVINAPADRIYPLVAASKRWQEWSMWNRRDPAMAMTFFGPEWPHGRWAHGALPGADPSAMIRTSRL